MNLANLPIAVDFHFKLFISDTTLVMSNCMYQQLNVVADHDDPFQRLEEKDVNVGDNDEESNLERLMQEKDVDTSLFTAINEVAEVLTQNQAEISDLASLDHKNISVSSVPTLLWGT